MQLADIKPIPGAPDYGVSADAQVYRITRPKQGIYRNAALPLMMKPNRNGFVQLGAGGDTVKPRMVRRQVWG